ncbi:MAG: hypothetical protein ACYC6Y_09010 [Thermoguttaceae bacterium]
MRPLVSVLVGVVLVAGLSAGEPGSLHPPFALLDGGGKSVLDSGRPVSTMRTCGGCHDTAYIEGHSYHAWLGGDERTGVGFVEGGRPWDFSPGPFGRWDPLDYRYVSPPGDPRLDLGVADWTRLLVARHVGGGPARSGHAGLALERASLSGEGNPDALVLDPGTGMPRVWDWQRSGTVEMNCFLCHIGRPDNESRIEELAVGRFAWSGTATLAATGVVRRTAEGWQYDRQRFGPQGTLEASVLGLGDPQPENCGLCHGHVHTGAEPMQLVLSSAARATATTGRVFSGQRMSDSGVNLAGKQELGRPWDIHAERLVGCTDCHFSMNNPAFDRGSMAGDDRFIGFDPRRSSVGEYLLRPSHQFAKGTTAQGSTAGHLGGTMRRCGDCHQAEALHEWLPYQAVHMAALSCEVCHIPHASAPAVESIDWTVPSSSGKPAVTWRGIEGDVNDPAALVTGFRPLLLPRRDVDGGARLVPCNLVTAIYWVDNGPLPRPVRLPDLEQIVAGGASDRGAVRDGLVARGYANPEIRTEVQPYEIHHGVVGGRWATRSCDACHSAGSILDEPMTLASGLPSGKAPRWSQMGALSPSGEWSTAGGRPVFRPSTQGAGFYVLGHDGHRWIDALGMLMLAGVVTGVTLHGGLRVRRALAGQARPAVGAAATERQAS